MAKYFNGAHHLTKKERARIDDERKNMTGQGKIKRNS